MKMISLLTAGSAASLCLIGLASPVLAFNVVNPNADYAGKSQFEWAKSWWKAVLDAPAAGNPLDPSSPGSSLNLINDPLSSVYFLTGTGPGTPTSRDIEITSDKAIFFPVFNAFAVEPRRDPIFTPKALCDETSGFFSPSTQTLFASIDSGGGPVNIDSGANLANAYQQGCSEDPTNPNNVFTTNSPVPAVTSYLQQFIADYGIPPYTASDLQIPWDTVMDGYWVMLNPLAPGDYTINFGMTPATVGNYSQDNTWNVTVRQAPVPAPLPALGAAAALSWSRRLRRRIKGSTAAATRG